MGTLLLGSLPHAAGFPPLHYLLKRNTTMGLDQTLYIEDARLADLSYHYHSYSSNEGEDGLPRLVLKDWRKHPDLHGYMTDMAIAKGLVEKKDDFNCVPLHLDGDDCQQILLGIAAHRLPKTQGFFFGDSGVYFETSSVAHDIATFTEAIVWCDEGFTVTYNSWW